MKKILFFVLCTILALSLLVGCGKEEKKGNEEITITMGTQENPTHPLYKAYEKFGEELERLSGGKMKLEIFPSSQLGDYRALVEQIKSDDLDMLSVGYSDMSYLVPEFVLVGQPYVLRDYEHMLKVEESEYGQRIKKELAKHNLESLDIWYLGTRNTTSSRPLNSIDDFKGLKLRVPNVETLINFAKATGAIPSPVAFSELYLALQTGQVEAQENPLPTIRAEKLYEIQDYIAMTQHYVAGMQLLMNKRKYDSFTDEQKRWIQEATAVGKELANTTIFEQEENLIKEFQDLGITITYPDLEPFREAMKPYYDEVEKKFKKGTIAEIMSIQ